MTDNHPPQQFRPLSYMPLISSISAQQVADLRKLRQDLASARTRPHVFDDATIERVISVHTETLGFVPFTRRQLDHWDEDEPSVAERETIQRIRDETDEIELLVREVLSLAEEIKVGTIDKVLAKDEFDVGWDALASTLPGKALARGSSPGRELDPEQLAALIDARVADLASAGQSDRAIFDAVGEYFPAIKQLLADDRLSDLCERHPGLDRYVGIVEDVMLDLMRKAQGELGRYRGA
jgi:hypothetical protein